MMKMNEKALMESESSSQIFTILSDIPSDVNDVDELIETSIRVASSVNKSMLDVSRRKHQAYLMAQNGAIINPSNYQSLPLIRERAQFRQVGGDGVNGGESGASGKNSSIEAKGKQLLKILRRSVKNGKASDVNNNSTGQLNKNSELSMRHDDVDEAKMKNIVQTELLVNLRQIIIKIAHHFQAHDPEKYSDIFLNADYSIESHTLDYERYMDTSKVNICL